MISSIDLIWGLKIFGGFTGSCVILESPTFPCCLWRHRSSRNYVEFGFHSFLQYTEPKTIMTAPGARPPRDRVTRTQEIRNRDMPFCSWDLAKGYDSLLKIRLRSKRVKDHTFSYRPATSTDGPRFVWLPSSVCRLFKQGGQREGDKSRTGTISNRNLRKFSKSLHN